MNNEKSMEYMRGYLDGIHLTYPDRARGKTAKKCLNALLLAMNEEGMTIFYVSKHGMHKPYLEKMQGVLSALGVSYETRTMSIELINKSKIRFVSESSYNENQHWRGFRKYTEVFDD